jgi:hypothetical protein
MNCPSCNQSHAADTFVCAGCGCKVYQGKKVAEMPAEFKVTTHRVLSAWRIMQLMIGGSVVIVAGIGMLLLQAYVYGIFLMCIGIAVFAFGAWITPKPE